MTSGRANALAGELVEELTPFPMGWLKSERAITFIRAGFIAYWFRFPDVVGLSGSAQGYLSGFMC